MGVTKNKGHQLSEAEIEEQEILEGTRKPVEPEKAKVSTEQHNRWAKKRASNMRRLRAIFNGTHKRGQKMPDGWKSENYSAPVKKKSKDEEVAEKPAVAKAVKKMKRRQK